ncbi:MAG: flagellar biosynthesis protein FlhF [Bacillota bacterium]
MRIKRYIARDMQEAVALIKQDMGLEAVIISSRHVRGRGLWGFFTRQLEVTAALDERKVLQTPEVVEEMAVSHGFLPVEEQLVQTSSHVAAPFNPAEDVQLRRELSEVKNLLHRLSGQAESGEDAFTLKWRRILTEMEIKEEIVDELIAALETEVSPDQPHCDEAAEVFLLNRMAQIVEPVYQQNGTARVIAFVGPTGVGKTTTLAKLAAQLRLFYQKNVALVTVDTFRIGAVEQLRTYAEIIDIPFEVAMTPEELKRALDNHLQADHILVDTAGRPSKNLQQVFELKGFIEVIPKPCDIYLVLSCNTKFQDILRAAEDFSRLDYNKLIFTKLDETESLGSILNLIKHIGLPVVYLTNGQSVPEDIETLYPKKLAKLLLKGGSYIDGSGAQAANPR